MAKSNAERQAAYRRRHLKDIEGTRSRLNLLVDHRAKLALARLSKHYGITQTECLERLILETQTREVAGLSAEESSAYYDAITA